MLDDLREDCGVEAYLNYGALLGAVRDGAMIAHDSDTDVCYLSEQTPPADLILESYRIERALRAPRLDVLRMSGGDIKLLLPLSDGRTCHIDVFVAFYVDGTFYQLGNRSGELPESAILPISTIVLHGVEFPAPADPEAMLAFVYGPGWRVPDPSFKYADPVAGVRRLDGWLRGFRDDMRRWNAVLPRPGGRPRAARRLRVRPLGRRAGSRAATRSPTSGRAPVATRAFFARRGHRVRAYDVLAGRPRRGPSGGCAASGATADVRRLMLDELRTVAGRPAPRSAR